MKQVLAVRVGAKKAVGHIVSKRWWPTVVQVCVPEFNSVDFRVVKKRRCVICTRRGNDKQNELTEVVEKT